MSQCCRYCLSDRHILHAGFIFAAMAATNGSDHVCGCLLCHLSACVEEAVCCLCTAMNVSCALYCLAAACKCCVCHVPDAAA